MERAKAFEIAQDYIRHIAAKYPVKRAILFGSYAGGSPHPDSDIDLAIILDDAENLFDIQGQMMILRKSEAVYIEPHPFRESDFIMDDPFAAEIISTGVELEVPLSDSRK
ncbi:MAG: nucleotidyltransferase domain-containing protein [Ignavibacteriaceae bacterium]|nr:nucleotidyltransferase domain-containing protein [Ignavibacteriaceae bacterium]